jgi:hypothetical protein
MEKACGGQEATLAEVNHTRPAVRAAFAFVRPGSGCVRLRSCLFEVVRVAFGFRSLWLVVHVQELTFAFLHLFAFVGGFL